MTRSSCVGLALTTHGRSSRSTTSSRDAPTSRSSSRRSPSMTRLTSIAPPPTPSGLPMARSCRFSFAARMVESHSSSACSRTFGASSPRRLEATRATTVRRLFTSWATAPERRPNRSSCPSSSARRASLSRSSASSSRSRSRARARCRRSRPGCHPLPRTERATEKIFERPITALLIKLLPSCSIAHGPSFPRHDRRLAPHATAVTSSGTSSRPPRRAAAARCTGPRTRGPRRAGA